MCNKSYGQQGAALYIALMVLTVLLSLALGISTILLAQIQILRGIGHSVLAFAASETGVERVLQIDASSCAASATIDSSDFDNRYNFWIWNSSRKCFQFLDHSSFYCGLNSLLQLE